MRRIDRYLAGLLLVVGCATPDPGASPEATDVTVYDPSAAWNGYTLAFHRRTYPILIDMHGRVVRSWPEARVKTRVRLLEDCSLLAIGTGRSVVELDWNGDEVWSARFEDRLPHHDLVRLDNGNTMLLTRKRGSESDEVLEIDRAGEIVWEWSSGAPLSEWVESNTRRHTGDTTHLNSVQPLPDNPWHRAGDQRFRPGNVLLSARNINLALIVDRLTGEVVWSYRGDLDRQHEALMVGPESPRNGNIVIFDNRYSSFGGERQSEVIEIDPRDGSTVWSYAAPGLYSPTAGSQQPLPNGNVLVVSSMGGRALEVDRSGRTVWEWVPGFRLNRSARYAPDHCPELVALGPPDGPPIRPGGYRHVDRDSYQFSRAGQRRELQVDGVKRQVLEPTYRCARILVPGDASATLRYGIARRRIAALELESYAAEFSLILRNPADDRHAVVFEDTIAAEGDAWRERSLDLTALGLERVEMCVDLRERGLEGRAEPGTLAYWETPSISAGGAKELFEADARTDLTAEELAVQQEHLRAMGYVN